MSINNEGVDYSQEIILGKHPLDKNKAWLGIGFSQQKPEGAFGKIYSFLSSFKKTNVYYQPKFDGMSIFIYNLLWWLVLIGITVALLNMLPVGIFDGGRFFYLTILLVTKSKEKAKKFFSFSTYFILFLFFMLMIFWGISVFR